MTQAQSLKELVVACLRRQFGPRPFTLSLIHCTPRAHRGAEKLCCFFRMDAGGKSRFVKAYFGEDGRRLAVREHVVSTFLSARRPSVTWPTELWVDDGSPPLCLLSLPFAHGFRQTSRMPAAAIPHLARAISGIHALIPQREDEVRGAVAHGLIPAASSLRCETVGRAEEYCAAWNRIRKSHAGRLPTALQAVFAILADRYVRRSRDATARLGVRSAKVLIHGDLIHRNIFIRGHEIRVVDWQTAKLGDGAFDLAMAGIWLGETKARWLLDEYQQCRGRVDRSLGQRVDVLSVSIRVLGFLHRLIRLTLTGTADEIIETYRIFREDSRSDPQVALMLDGLPSSEGLAFQFAAKRAAR